MSDLKCVYVVLDEYALASALKEMGVVFFRRTPDSVVISFVNKFNLIVLFELIFDCSSEVKKNNMKY